jgi:hypothetical protein
MGYNPPITRDEVQDTLKFMNIPFSYEKINEPGKGHVFSFSLTIGFIDIYGPSFIKYRRKRYQSHRELVEQLAKDFPENCN